MVPLLRQLKSLHSRHITNLHALTPYTGTYHVYLGNGQRLPIVSKGAIPLTPSLSLNNVFFVPTMVKNLLSVSQFTKDNHCSIEFFSSYFVVKEQASSRDKLNTSCMCGTLEDPSQSCLASSRQPFSIWHVFRSSLSFHCTSFNFISASSFFFN